MKAIEAKTPATHVRRRLLASGLVTFFAVAYLSVASWSALADPQGAQAQNTSTLYWLNATENDGFYNFDFKSQNASSNNVDWPMRFLFFNNAEIDKVKDALDGCHSPYIPAQTCNNGGGENAAFNDNLILQWDSDGGKKQTNTCSSSGAQHMRFYANPVDVYPYDRNYNTAWGYYIFAAVHKDYEGGSGGSCTTYYSAEGEEGWWVQRMLDYLPGWSQQSNSYYWYNYDGGHWDLYGGNYHWTQSNGYASYVSVP
jgi:hypothetical protein